MQATEVNAARKEVFHRLVQGMTRDQKTVENQGEWFFFFLGGGLVDAKGGRKRRREQENAQK